MNKKKHLMKKAGKMLLIFIISLVTFYSFNNGVQAKTERTDEEISQEIFNSSQDEQKEKEETSSVEKTDTMTIGQPASGENTKSKEIDQKVTIDIPASVTGKKEQGAGTVVDFTTTGSKAFYTIQDKNQETYYLIIDLDKTENNVYFLSDVNKESMEVDETKEVEKSQLPTSSMNEVNKEQEEIIKEKNKPAEKESNSLFYVIAFGVMFAVIYYFKVYKKKDKNKKENNDDDMMDDSYEDDFLVNTEDEEVTE